MYVLHKDNTSKYKILFLNNFFFQANLPGAVGKVIVLYINDNELDSERTLNLFLVL